MIYFHLSAGLQNRFKMLSVIIIAYQTSLPPCARKAILLGAKIVLSPLSTNYLSYNRLAPITI